MEELYGAAVNRGKRRVGVFDGRENVMHSDVLLASQVLGKGASILKYLTTETTWSRKARLAVRTVFDFVFSFRS